MSKEVYICNVSNEETPLAIPQMNFSKDEKDESKQGETNHED